MLAKQVGFNKGAAAAGIFPGKHRLAQDLAKLCEVLNEPVGQA